MASNAPPDLSDLDRMASAHRDYKDEGENLASAKSCISAYRDTLLAIARNDTTIERLRISSFTATIRADPV